MTKFVYKPEDDMKEYAHEVKVKRVEDQPHISVVISDFVDFLLAMGFQKGSIEKYIPYFDAEFGE